MWYFGEECGCFFPCLKNLPKVKLKSLGLVLLAEEISKHPYVDSVVGFLVLSLMKTYNEKERAEQGKIQNVQSKEDTEMKWS